MDLTCFAIKIPRPKGQTSLTFGQCWLFQKCQYKYKQTEKSRHVRFNFFFLLFNTHFFQVVTSKNKARIKNKP